VRAGDPKWCGGFPPPLRLSDQSEGDVGERDRSQQTSLCVPPASFLLLYTRNVTGVHNHQLVDAPDQGTRSNRLRLCLIPLDTRWGQSNTEYSSDIWVWHRYQINAAIVSITARKIPHQRSAGSSRSEVCLLPDEMSRRRHGQGG
jgi:hypothetical protein